MRVTAGVLLLVVAVIYIFAGFGYFLGGAVVAGGSKVAQMAEDQMQKDGKTPTADQQAALDKLKTGQLEKKGGGLLVFGVLLLATAGIDIAAAVSLFQRKRFRLIVASAVLVAACEIISAIVTKFGVTNIFGLIAAGFAIAGAMSVRKAAQPAEAPAVAA